MGAAAVGSRLLPSKLEKVGYRADVGAALLVHFALVSPRSHPFLKKRDGKKNKEKSLTIVVRCRSCRWLPGEGVASCGRSGGSIVPANADGCLCHVASRQRAYTCLKVRALCVFCARTCTEQRESIGGNAHVKIKSQCTNGRLVMNGRKHTQ